MQIDFFGGFCLIFQSFHALVGFTESHAWLVKRLIIGSTVFVLYVLANFRYRVEAMAVVGPGP